MLEAGFSALGKKTGPWTYGNIHSEAKVSKNVLPEWGSLVIGVANVLALYYIHFWLDMSIHSIYSNRFLLYLYLAPCVPCASNDFFSDLPNSSCFNVDWIFSLTCIESMVSTACANWLECDCHSPPPRGYKSHKATMRSWATSNNFASFISGTASLCHEGWTPMLVKKKLL